MTEFKPGDLITRFQGEKTSIIKNDVPLTFKRYGGYKKSTLQVKQSHEVFFSSNFRKWVEIKLPDVKWKIQIGDLVSLGSCEIIVTEIENTIISGCDKAGEKVWGWKSKCKLIKTAEELKAEEIAAQKEKDNLNLFEIQRPFPEWYKHSINTVVRDGDIVKFTFRAEAASDSSITEQEKRKDDATIEYKGELTYKEMKTERHNVITEPEKQACRDIDEKIIEYTNKNNAFVDKYNLRCESAHQHSERLKSLFLKSATCSGTELLVYMINNGIV